MRNKKDDLATLSRVFVALVIPLLVLTLSYPNASAQTGSSSFVGTVTDQTGAIVPGAKVTVVNQATGVVKTVATNAVGEYEVDFLSDGTYTVSVEHPGFQKDEVRDVRLDVRSVGRVDFSIKPATGSTQVTVKSSPPLLTTDSADVGGLYKTNDLEELPIQTRDFAVVQELIPGMVRGYDAGESWGYVISPGYVSGGGSLNSIDFSIDGSDNNRPYTYHNASSPSLDMIAEVKVDTGGQSAEYGRGNAEVEVSLKSGTNRFHGDAFDYLQNNDLNARYVQATQAPNPLHVNQFGASLGGPIVKNKLFFMFAWTSTRNDTSYATITRMPTAAEWAGHEIESVVDPLTGKPFPNTDGHTIPANRISTLAAAVKACCSATPNAGLYWQGPVENKNNRNNYDAKVDWIPRPSDNFAFSWGRQYFTYLLGETPNLSADYDDFRGQRAAVHWTHTFAPNFVNTLVVGGHGDWEDGDQLDAMNGTENDFISKTGMQLPSYIPGLPHFYIPTMNRFGGWFGPLSSVDSTYQINDTAHLIKGQHTLSFGLDFRLLRQNPIFDFYSRSELGYYGGFSGSDFGDFLLGIPTLVFYAPPVGQLHTQYDQFATFFQDNWKVTRNLTINLGLRYEYTSWPTERDNVLASIVPNTGQVAIASSASGVYTTRITSEGWDSAKAGTFVAASKVGLPNRTLVYPDKRDWAPRVGFAYRPSFMPSTTVRGSYGIGYDPEPTVGFTMSNFFTVPPFTAEVDFDNSDPTLTSLNPLRSYESPTPPNIIPGDFLDPHLKQAYFETWGLNVQKALPGNIVVDLGYQGSHGSRITMAYSNFNQSLTLPDTSSNGTGRYPGFTTITGFTSNGKIENNSLQLKVRKEFSHGLTFTSSYTWANDMDNGGQWGAGQFNIYDQKLDWGPAASSRRHVWTTDFVYQLPFGKGRKWGGGMNSVLDGFLGGWQLSSILNVTSGDFFEIDSYNALANLNTQVVPRADRVGSGHLSHRTTAEWFDTSAFVEPPTCCRGGNAARGVVEGPGSIYPDLAIGKNFKLREGWRLQFRADAYNFINHPNWLDPDNILEDTSYGQILNFGNPRTMQLGLKFVF
jgi:hypothetical protein